MAEQQENKNSIQVIERMMSLLDVLADSPLHRRQEQPALPFPAYDIRCADDNRCQFGGESGAGMRQ